MSDHNACADVASDNDVMIPYLAECQVCGSISEGQAQPFRILDYMGRNMGRNYGRLKPYCPVCKTHTEVYVVSDMVLRMRYEGSIREWNATS